MALLITPPPRWSGVMAELPTSSELVLFGGKTTANLYNGITSYSGILNDSWSWNGSAWSNLTTGISGNTLTAPGRRYEAAMAFDGTYTTLVGGSDGNVNLSDVWSYSTGTGWFQQPLSNAVNPPSNYDIPTTQRASSIAYQSGVGGGEVIMFGGISSFQRHYVRDSWLYQGGNPGTWTQLNPVNSPSGRTYAAMASSATTAVLFGGKNFDGATSDTWTWAGSNWVQVSGLTIGTTSPPALYGASMVYDAANSTYVLFGGISLDGRFNSSTWSFSTGTNQWTLQSSANAPPARAFAQMAYHTASSSVILFGGLNSTQNLGDTWSLSSSYVWSLLG